LGLFIPLTSVTSLGNHGVTPVLQVAFGIGLMFFVLSAKMPRFYWPNQRYKRSDTSRPLRRLVYCISIVTVPFILYFLIENGTSKLNFDVTQVYSFREDQKESLGSLLTVVANWIGKILLPIGLVVSIHLEKRLFAVFFIVMIFALFGIINSKSGVAYSFLALTFYLYSRNRPVSTYSLFLLASVFIVLVSAAAVIFDLPLAAAFLVRRAIFTPSMLFLDYVEFFQAHTHVWWSNSFTAGLIDYPLDDNIGRSIASYNNKLSNANSGIFSMGYAHAGFLGLIIYSLCLAFIIKMIDKHADPRHMMVLSSVALGPLAHVILNVDLLTSMYTHGIGLFILICFLFFYRQHTLCQKY
jgi:hypothetical protein